jgi:uncharacterized protein (TIGR03435 family)
MRTVLTLAVVATAFVSAHAQAPAPAAEQTPQPAIGQSIAFDAVSVKPDDGSSPGWSIGLQPGRFVADNISLRTMIVTAYSIQPNQLIGDPSWVNNDRWDVVATMPAGLPPPPLGSGPSGNTMLALRTMLADRFGLQMHREAREIDVYDLVFARPDRRLGPEVKPAAENCAPDSVNRSFCGVRNLGPGRIAITGMPMSFFAGSLTGRVGRHVVDKTGLTSLWDFTLTFAPERPIGSATPVEPALPTLFAALQEQLGLKLEAARGPVEILVVDKVSRPTAD